MLRFKIIGKVSSFFRLKKFEVTSSDRKLAAKFTVAAATFKRLMNEQALFQTSGISDNIQVLCHIRALAGTPFVRSGWTTMMPGVCHLLKLYYWWGLMAHDIVTQRIWRKSKRMNG